MNKKFFKTTILLALISILIVSCNSVEGRIHSSDLGESYIENVPHITLNGKPYTGDVWSTDNHTRLRIEAGHPKSAEIEFYKVTEYYEEVSKTFKLVITKENGDRCFKLLGSPMVGKEFDSFEQYMNYMQDQEHMEKFPEHIKEDLKKSNPKKRFKKNYEIFLHSDTLLNKYSRYW